MQEETVSSGRSPASNNGLVAYTPSRGLISIRGNWPLYVTCDVIVPHTRTVADMLDILDVVVAEDEITEGDFWRAQPFVKLPKPSTMRPKSYRELANDGQSLRGKVIGVPKMYIGGDPPQDQDRPVHTRQSVIDLWRQAKKDLEALGAEVREVADFPLVTNYERHAATATHNVPGLPDNWGEAERGIVIAYSWDDFLRANGDPGLPDAWAVDASKIFPRSLDEVQWKWSEMSNLVGYDTLFESWLPRDRRRGKSIFEIPGMREACLALEATRKRDLEDWMDRLGLDLVAFPANGDVGRADADTDDDSARHAWKNGVKYSNGNRALRHLGAPTVSVTMGVMEDTKMPVGLTFVSKAYDDNNLLRYAYAYEQKSRRRIAPPLTPTLDTDCILRPRSAISKKKEEGPGAGRGEVTTTNATKPVELFLSGSRRAGGVPPSEEFVVNLRGKVRVTDGSGITSLTVYVDGEKVDGVEVDHHGDWAVVAQTRVPQVPAHVKTEAAIARDQVMVVVVVETGAGVQAGRLLLL
jgi:Asp-tRNA(Asn)/Glu-tRNA(Gln) amidotransferase A subunit family amidase